jgi:hypothetical protein
VFDQVAHADAMPVTAALEPQAALRPEVDHAARVADDKAPVALLEGNAVARKAFSGFHRHRAPW